MDSLHAWCDAAPGGINGYESLTLAVESLRSLAAALVAPILVLSEENRASQGRGGVNAGAGNRRIEYRSESVWGLRREDDPVPCGQVPVTLHLEKNRNGSIGEPVPLLFHGTLQRFEEE